AGVARANGSRGFSDPRINPVRIDGDVEEEALLDGRPERIGHEGVGERDGDGVPVDRLRLEEGRAADVDGAEEAGEADHGHEDGADGGAGGRGRDVHAGKYTAVRRRAVSRRASRRGG